MPHSVSPPSAPPPDASTSEAVTPTYLAGLPFYGLSRSLYRGTKAVLSRLFASESVADQSAAADPASWTTLDALTQLPLGVPYMMVTGPRWNTHARIASAGPFHAERRIVVDVDGLAEANWYVVLHRLPTNEMLQWADHTQSDADATVTFDVDPGTYLLVARLYPTGRPASFPPVHVDGGATSVPSRDAGVIRQPQVASQFHRRSLFYDALHHHVFFALHHRRHFDTATVRRQYLPVGNPGTQFRYGAVRPGEAVEVTWTDAVEAQYRLFLSAYNRSSFPIYSAPLTPEATATSRASRRIATTPFDAAATYLLRVVPRVGAPDDGVDLDAALHTQAGPPASDVPVVPSRAPQNPTRLHDVSTS